MIYTITLNPAVDFHIVKTDGESITESYMVPGGKGINVSMMLSHLGVMNECMGFLGGMTGDFIKSSLLKLQNIKMNFVDIKDQTRMNIKMHQPYEKAYNQLGPKVTCDEIDIFFKRLSLIQKNDIVIISGRGLIDHHDVYEKTVMMLNGKNISFVLDLTGRKLIELLQYQPLLIKPNLEELGEAFNQDIKDLDEAIYYGKELIGLGARYVMVSMGKNGSILISKDSIYQALPININVLSSVGAGDAMVAGFIKAYQENKDLKSCYIYAVACATATTMSKDMAVHKDVIDILNKVKIKELNHADF